MENLAARLKELCSAKDEDGLKGLALELGFAEAGKTMANFAALHDVFGDDDLLARLANTALTTADPDQSLNNLERLTNEIAVDQLLPALTDSNRQQQLLTVLGASQFLTGIL